MERNNTIIYTRVSTDEQANQGYSLQYQEAITKAECELKKFKVLYLFKEDYSAKTFNRPEWERLISIIKGSKGLVHRIVFTRWCRFSRDGSGAQAMVKYLQKQNIEIHCIEQPIDFNSPDALLLLSIYTTIPEIENKKISIRTIEGMRQASLIGCWVGKQPFGYDRDWVQLDSQRKNATLIPNSDSEIVVKIFEYFIQSYSAESIRSRIKSEYGKKISKQGILNILTNICYLGKVRVKEYKNEPEVIVKGIHTAIISDEVFSEAQDVLKGKRRKHVRKDNLQMFPLKSIIKCSNCGRSITASTTTKSKGLLKYPYYHCSITKGHDRYAANLVHDCFEKVLMQFKVKEEIGKLYRTVVLDTINSLNKGINLEKDKIEKEVAIIQNRIKNAEDMLADGGGDKKVYISMLKRFKDEENTLIMRHATLKAEAMPKNSDVDYLIDLFNSFYLLYKESDYPLKKQIVSSIFPKPMIFSKDHFRTEQVSPLLELLILNCNNLQGLEIKTSHFKSDSSSSAPPVGLEPTTL